MRNKHWSLSLATRTYRLTSRLLPRGFRAHYGMEAEQMFLELAEEAWADKGARGVLQIWAHSTFDLVRRARHEHGHGRKTASQIGVARPGPLPGRSPGGLVDPGAVRRKARPLEGLTADFKYAVRTLAKNPLATAVVLLTLALGIGANAATFSIVNGVLLRPLPYPNPDRLVTIGWMWQLENGGPGVWFSAFKFDYWNRNSRVFETLSASQPFSRFNLGDESEPELIRGARVTEGYFSVLGLDPARGRFFLPEEDRPGAPMVVVVSDGFWRRRLGGEAGALGQTIDLDGVPRVVVGVLPDEVQLQGRPDVIVPLQLDPDPRDMSHAYQIIGRLRTGVDYDTARTDMHAVMARLGQEAARQGANPETNGIFLQSYRDTLVGDLRGSLFVLLGAVAFVLLIACSNVANILLSRAVTRDREIAIRAALGASRGRIVRQLLVESALLALAGGVAGVLLAVWSLESMTAILPRELPRLEEVRLDGTVLVFSFFASAAAGLIFGLASSMGLSKPNLGGSLKEGGRTADASAGHKRLRDILVVSEVALSVVLLTGAVVLVVSFLELRAVDAGFDPDGLLAMEMSLTSVAYETPAQSWDFQQRVLDRISALPGVTSAATVSSVPLERGMNNILGIDGDPEDTRVFIEHRAVSHGYFRTLGVGVLLGREFSETDTESSPRVVIINRELADMFWRDGNPLGSTVTIGKELGDLEEPPRVIIGVVGNVKEQGLAVDAVPTVFVPQTQVPASSHKTMNEWFPMVWLVRADAQSMVAGQLRELVAEVDPAQPVMNLRTMHQVISDITRQPQSQSLLMGLFAAVALMLTVVGIYGVISYSVSQRTREFGIRMALGAESRSVLRMVIYQGMKVTVVGLGLGLVGSLALARVLESLVFEVSPTDPVILASVVISLLAVAILACVVPARRATRVDPLIALRSE
jgi:putative ABC transport system permease protein